MARLMADIAAYDRPVPGGTLTVTVLPDRGVIRIRIVPTGPGTIFTEDVLDADLVSNGPRYLHDRIRRQVELFRRAQQRQRSREARHIQEREPEKPQPTAALPARRIRRLEVPK